MDQPGDLIFISIAAYRDTQLVPTVHDCMAKALHPGRLRFGICWQHDTLESSLPWTRDGRFAILDVDWRDSQGACWARDSIMKLWRGEPWFFQVDSHCRFARGWDEKLIQTTKALQESGSPKPILSTYGSAFTPGEEEVLAPGPLLIAVQSFTPDGIPEQKPFAMPGWHRRTTPMRARFLGAGFLFTQGAFVEEVGYDPELYFQGEETTLALRAFTHGYDLFHPCETIVWHDYVRQSANRHWENHTSLTAAGRDWSHLEARSRAKVRRLLAGGEVASHGLGQVRSLADYEAYAGLSFSRRKLQDYTMRAEEPPNPAADPGWADRVLLWMARITIDFLDLPPGSVGDPAFWRVTIHDGGRSEIYSRDFPRGEIETLTGNEDVVNLICEFQSPAAPATWSLEPHSRTIGRLGELRGRFAEADYTILLEDDPADAVEGVSLDGR